MGWLGCVQRRDPAVFCDGHRGQTSSGFKLNRGAWCCLTSDVFCCHGDDFDEGLTLHNRAVVGRHRIDFALRNRKPTLRDAHFPDYFSQLGGSFAFAELGSIKGPTGTVAAHARFVIEANRAAERKHLHVCHYVLFPIGWGTEQ